MTAQVLLLSFPLQTFTTLETITNAKSAKQWLLNSAKEVKNDSIASLKRRAKTAPKLLLVRNFDTNALNIFIGVEVYVQL